MNVLSWLEKHYTKRYRFENLQTTGERSKSIELKVFEVAGGGEGATEPVVVTVIGRGTNKQTCKVAAARRFMHAKRKEALLASQSDTTTTTTTTDTTTTMSRSSTISSSFSAELKSSSSGLDGDDDDEEDEENELEIEESKVVLVDDYDSEDSDSN